MHHVFNTRQNVGELYCYANGTTEGKDPNHAHVRVCTKECKTGTVLHYWGSDVSCTCTQEAIKVYVQREL